MGPNNLPAIGLKTRAPELTAPLAKFFQCSSNTVIYLTMWKIAKVFSVHKKQGKFNHRPISALSMISKVMEGVINNAIKQHLLSNNLLTDAQFGFCQGYSAPDHITALVQAWIKELNLR
eukprot:g30734.t1